MAKLKIVKVGDDTLRQTCREVDKITPRILRLLGDMTETMRAADGCGLAAPQVGILRRICVVEVGDKLYEMINPQIVESEGVQEEVEGCLSIPGQWGVTHRPAKVTVEYFDKNTNRVRVSAEGLLARAFCHEIDHLDGVLFTDKAIRMIDPDELN